LTLETISNIGPSTVDEYIPISDDFDYDLLRQSPNFRVKKYQDAVFRGEVVSGKRTGLGVMIYRTGRIYEGRWENDQRHGRAYEKYANGNTYKGFFA
jgi:hypothetical protein